MKKLLIATMVAALAACSTTSPDVIQRGDAQRMSQVQDATAPQRVVVSSVPALS